MNSPAARKKPARAWWMIAIYIVLVIASNLVDRQLDTDRLAWGNKYMTNQSVKGPGKDSRLIYIDTTGLAVNLNPLPYRVILEGDPNSTLPPVVLIHGSPGAAIGFHDLAPRLAVGGRRVIYFDLPGFASASEPSSTGSIYEDYSSAAYAKIIWRMLDAMDINGRAHIVGWSNGGAVALRMIEQDHDRVASLTLLAAVGAQENEATGSYAFEHFKYKVGRGLLVYGAKLVPHFGAFGPASERNAFLRYFDDTDQRDLGPFMETLDTPAMVMHGRHDFLISWRAAEDHYRKLPNAQLVMLDAMHFIPMLKAQQASEFLNPFFARHDTPGAIAETDYIDLAPLPERHGFDALLHKASDAVLGIPWWVQLILIVLLVRYAKLVGLAITMILVATHSVDFAVGILGMLGGRAWWLVHGSHRINRPFTLWGWVRGVAFILPVFVVGILGAMTTRWLTHGLGTIGFVLGLAIMVSVFALMRMGVTWEGRQRIKGEYARITCHEYWLTGVVYLPMIWWGIKRIASGKGLLPLTAVNPGYAHDGGIMSESKMDINRKLGDGPGSESVDDQAILHCVLIDTNDNTQARIDLAIHALDQDAKLGGYPVFCKPDQGERGRAVEMIKTESALIDYTERNSEPFVIQQRHAGPMEAGVLWVRHLESITGGPESNQSTKAQPSGFIYAITIKHFPVVVGNGKDSIRRLILGHERYRAQSRMFFDRMGPRLREVPAPGQQVSLGDAGNHAQGAMFTDGAHLITPELSGRITQIVNRFVDDQGRVFDIGRFDIRCESLEQLAKGEGFGIVELNGLTSEPTNLYDPERSFLWAWDMLYGYWIHAEHIAKARIDTNTGEPVDRESWKKIKRALARVMFT
tara:strand:+ start:30677 stop:33259 length:2583 start_codon:yes stop_codon:yes gene_type:complete